MKPTRVCTVALGRMCCLTKLYAYRHHPTSKVGSCEEQTAALSRFGEGFFAYQAEILCIYIPSNSWLPSSSSGPLVFAPQVLGEDLKQLL